MSPDPLTFIKILIIINAIFQLYYFLEEITYGTL